MNNISPRQLEVFVGIAGEGSVRAAAKRLHLTQPAASMALAELERNLDTVLFARNQGRLHLNERGRELLPMAREILERLEEIRYRAINLPGELRGELRLGASNTVGNYRVGELLGAFVEAHPRVTIRLIVGNTHDIIAAVREHRLDVGCIEGDVMRSDIEVRRWRPDDLVVCVRPDHPLAGRPCLQAADFAGARWIMREQGSATRLQTERILSSLPAGETVLELGQVEAIKQAVIAGLGMACLPEVAVQDAIRVGRLAALNTPFLSLRRHLSLILASNVYHGALVQEFVGSVPLEG